MTIETVGLTVVNEYNKKIARVRLNSCYFKSCKAC